ncbi:chitobiase/beta-hexosaminidase C-terminal domain-containing protein [Luteolibacter marinus]|uniref:chitobiase/beta-hexosaminidase C-terminal domain-containing protein n=1 Tax=Luteolibacter marinus TaxID=2776705 RepID=UPI0018675DE7|nr:chitobiase/beta-hexosaminidase C-terminal domain-containing protein [Luteolibacter marinus]
MYDENVANTIQVACSWSAIETALKGVTDAQANSGTLILIAPGNLTGNGNSSGSKPVLENLGSVSWNQRVTIAPRDGYGTVKLLGGVRFLKVHGVCFAGFQEDGNDGIKMQGCRRSALAWTKCTGHLGLYGTDGFVTEGMEIVEVVQPNHYVKNGDSADYYAGGGGFSDWRFDGCYHAPRFFEYPYTGSKPHTDTVQFAAAGGGSYDTMVFRDSAFFASNNCSIQTGNVDGLALEHCYVVSGEVSLSRYPHLPGGSTEATTNAFNGSGRGFEAKDSIFIGGMAINTSDAARPWRSVINTKVDRSYGSSNQPLSGQWTVDTSLNATNSGMPPYPTDAYLSTIWAKPGATSDVSVPVLAPRGGTYGSPQLVTMTCSTAGASIYYTTNGSTPTISSTKYTGPVTVSASATIRAFATAPDLDASSVQTEDYFIVNQVSAPVISPQGGQFSSAQSVTITCPTAGATIYYTLNGSTPTSSSTVYSGPILVSSTSTLKAVGVKVGSENSPVASAQFGIGNSYAASEAWTNVSIPTQTGAFTISWNAMPDANQIDGVMGLSLGAASGYDDLACIVRFASSGFIDVRNGGSYQALATVPYGAGTMYHFELSVDLAAKKYSVKVTPNGGSAVQIAQNYSFRTQQSTVSSLDHLGLVSLGSGSHIVSDIVIGTTPPPSAPQGLRITSAP